MSEPVKLRRQRWSGGHATKREAEAALRKALGEVEKGEDPFPEDVLFSEYALRWIEQRDIRASTRVRYRSLLRHHLLPALGQIPLRRIKPAHLRDLMEQMRGKGLKPRSIIQCRALCSSIMETALGDGLVMNNPARAAKPPTAERPTLEVPNAAGVRAIIAASEGTRWEAPVLLACAAGLRRSETLGLTWAAVDLDKATISVARGLHRVEGTFSMLDPKTKRAARTLEIPPFAVEHLRRWKVAQAQRRLAIGEGWAAGDLVCDDGKGQPVKPDVFTRSFRRLAKRVGYPNTRLHDARHGFATLLLEADVHPAIASAALGHSREAFTMERYQHVRTTAAAAKAIEDALGG
ncbi:MAG: tyrosine-type recombinase/integrase [Actinomycetota bacterium]